MYTLFNRPRKLLIFSSLHFQKTELVKTLLAISQECTRELLCSQTNKTVGLVQIYFIWGMGFVGTTSLSTSCYSDMLLYLSPL